MTNSLMRITTSTWCADHISLWWRATSGCLTTNSLLCGPLQTTAIVVETSLRLWRWTSICRTPLLLTTLPPRARERYRRRIILQIISSIMFVLTFHPSPSNASISVHPVGDFADRLTYSCQCLWFSKNDLKIESTLFYINPAKMISCSWIYSSR